MLVRTADTVLPDNQPQDVARPPGAPFADWTAVSSERGGLGWGTGPVSMGLAACIAALVTYRSIAGKRNAPRRFS